MLAVLQYGCASPADLGPLATAINRFTHGWFSDQPFALSERTWKRRIQAVFPSVF
jgi:hypothetical protein